MSKVIWKYVKEWFRKETKGLLGWFIGVSIGYIIGASSNFVFVDWLVFLAVFLVIWYGSSVIVDGVVFLWRKHKNIEVDEKW